MNSFYISVFGIFLVLVIVIWSYRFAPSIYQELRKWQTAAAGLIGILTFIGASFENRVIREDQRRHDMLKELLVRLDHAIDNSNEISVWVRDGTVLTVDTSAIEGLSSFLEDIETNEGDLEGILEASGFDGVMAALIPKAIRAMPPFASWARSLHNDIPEFPIDLTLSVLIAETLECDSRGWESLEYRLNEFIEVSTKLAVRMAMEEGDLGIGVFDLDELSGEDWQVYLNEQFDLSAEFEELSKFLTSYRLDAYLATKMSIRIYECPPPFTPLARSEDFGSLQDKVVYYSTLDRERRQIKKLGIEVPRLEQ